MFSGETANHKILLQVDKKYAKNDDSHFKCLPPWGAVKKLRYVKRRFEIFERLGAPIRRFKHRQLIFIINSKIGAR